tara:strand:+ start:378 stop:557 length:180 start_codon:yes stop_codon:yes gene_type:complete
MDLLGSQKQKANAIREAIIREQLKKILPLNIELIEILFCSYELSKQIGLCRSNLEYKKN